MAAFFFTLQPWDKVWQLRTKALWIVSPSSRAPADILAQQVWGQIRACHATVLGKAAFLSFYKLKPHYLEWEEDPSEILKGNPRENSKFSDPCISPLLLGGPSPPPPSFCVPTVCVCFLTPAKSLSSTSNFVCLVWYFFPATFASRFFLPFNLLMGRGTWLRLLDLNTSVSLNFTLFCFVLLITNCQHNYCLVVKYRLNYLYVSEKITFLKTFI